MKVEEILSGLKDLSKLELEKVRKECLALGSIGSKRRVSYEEAHQDWLLDGIKYELKCRGLERIVPGDFFIRNKSAFGNYYEVGARVRATFSENLPQAGKADFLLLGRILANMLARRVDKFAPVSLDTLLHNAGLAIECFDDAFPGYVSGGLLPFLIQTFREKNT